MFVINGNRVNIYAQYTDPLTGQIWPNLLAKDLQAKFGVQEIPDPSAPADFSDDLYYRTEQDTAPYVVYTKKSDEQITQVYWNKIKIKRDDIIDNGGCEVGGKWFHSDPKSKQQQLALAMLGTNLPAGLQWKTMDGTFVEMTPTLAAQLFAAQVARETAIFALAEEKKAALPADLDITVGWPAVYTPA